MLRTLELGIGSRREQLTLEYDALLADLEAPVIFPYLGFGSLLVSGERSRDGETFFSHRILAFSPEQKRRRFQQPLHQCDFYEDRALRRDVRRKLEFWIDPALLHTLWGPHLESVEAFVGDQDRGRGYLRASGKYRKHGDAWELVRWESALPSHLAVQLPADFQKQFETAKTTHHRFGPYSRALDRIRLCLEHRAIERTDWNGCVRVWVPRCKVWQRCNLVGKRYGKPARAYCLSQSVAERCG